MSILTCHVSIYVSALYSDAIDLPLMFYYSLVFPLLCISSDLHLS